MEAVIHATNRYCDDDTQLKVEVTRVRASSNCHDHDVVYLKHGDDKFVLFLDVGGIEILAGLLSEHLLQEVTDD